MNSHLKILLVEDESEMQRLLQEVIAPLMQAFPKSTVTVVSHLRDALGIIAETPAPDIVLLDLSLPDSPLEATIRQVTAIQDRSPLLIVTGHAVERVQELLRSVEAEAQIIAKRDAIQAGFLVRMIVDVIQSWRRKSFQKMDDNITRMRALLISSNEPK